VRRQLANKKVHDAREDVTSAKEAAKDKAEAARKAIAEAQADPGDAAADARARQAVADEREAHEGVIEARDRLWQARQDQADTVPYDEAHREAVKAQREARIAEQKLITAPDDVKTKEAEAGQARAAARDAAQRYRDAEAEAEQARRELAAAPENARRARELAAEKREDWRHNDPRRSRRIREEELQAASDRVKDAEQAQRRAERQEQEKLDALRQARTDNERSIASAHYNQARHERAQAETAATDARQAQAGADARYKAAYKRLKQHEARERAESADIQSDLELVGAQPKPPGALHVEEARDRSELERRLYERQRARTTKVQDVTTHTVRDRDPNTGQDVEIAGTWRGKGPAPGTTSTRPETVWQSQPTDAQGNVHRLDRISGYRNSSEVVSLPSRSVKTHEASHELTHPDFRAAHGGATHRNMNEGLTEMYAGETGMVARHPDTGKPRDEHPSWEATGAYKSQVRTMSKLSNALANQGGDPVRAAYFEGRVQDLHARIGAQLRANRPTAIAPGASDAQAGKTFLDALEARMENKDFAGADRLIGTLGTNP
jgi:colicin import membrane protein